MAPAPADIHGDAFGAGRLLAADSRMALALANEIRHRALHGVLGIPREQENVVTAVLALTALSATFEGARRVVSAPLGITTGDVGIGGYLLREAVVGVGGPGARSTPRYGTLIAVAVAGGLALPGLRRAAHALRVAEQRERARRITRYIASGGGNIGG